MARKSYVQIDGKLIDKDELNRPADAGFFVCGDIEPYQSMVTGEMIAGRRQHREHLRTHGLIELGNENPVPSAPKQDSRLKETVARIAYERLRY